MNTLRENSGRLVAVAVVFTALLSACADDTAPAELGAETTITTLDPPDSSVTSATSDTPVESDSTVQNDPGLTPLIDMAKADLAETLGTAPESISLISAVLVEWPNIGLGCEDGKQYPPGIVDGSEIVLEADGTRYSYRTGGTVYTPIRCE